MSKSRESKVSDRLLIARKRLGLTREQVAQATGYSVAGLYSIESHRHALRLSTVFDLIDFYGLTPGEVFE